MIDRNVILGGRGTMMAAAALAAGLSFMRPPQEPRPIKHGRSKLNRTWKQADRSKKQYLLKGIRP